MTQVKFEALVGRTSREVVQVRSKVYPWGAIFVRIITMERTGSGGVFRRDSGWQAASDGDYNLPSCVAHPGVVPRLTNIRRIRDTTNIYERVYPVGRLDFASEGLIILTNDGELTKLLTQAGVVPKVYHVKVSGKPLERDILRLSRGITLGGEKLAPSQIRLLKDAPNPWYEVTLHQGRNQQIRRMFQAIGHPVEKLKRVRIGFLQDPKLQPGQWRYLTEHEVAQLKKAGVRR